MSNWKVTKQCSPVLAATLGFSTPLVSPPNRTHAPLPLLSPPNRRRHHRKIDALFSLCLADLHQRRSLVALSHVWELPPQQHVRRSSLSTVGSNPPKPRPEDMLSWNEGETFGESVLSDVSSPFPQTSPSSAMRCRIRVRVSATKCVDPRCCVVPRHGRARYHRRSGIRPFPLKGQAQNAGSICARRKSKIWAYCFDL
jgi:hypothetical protein